jgi:predicted DNA-binding ribbon-helix-helix protein
VALIRKTMRVGGRETCVALEPQFWACLAELAAERRVSVVALVGQVAAARPAGVGLASALRTFALAEVLAEVLEQMRRGRQEQERRPPGGRDEVA